MDIEKPIEQLHDASQSQIGMWAEDNSAVIGKSATALSMLQAENEKLRAELEQVKAERNGAIKDLNDFLSLDELCPIQCKWCKWGGTNCDGKTPEWRGPQKED